MLIFQILKQTSLGSLRPWLITATIYAKSRTQLSDWTERNHLLTGTTKHYRNTIFNSYNNARQVLIVFSLEPNLLGLQAIWCQGSYMIIWCHAAHLDLLTSGWVSNTAFSPCILNQKESSALPCNSQPKNRGDAHWYWQWELIFTGCLPCISDAPKIFYLLNLYRNSM